MNNTHSNLRRFIVACLAISLSMVGVYPGLWTASATELVSTSASETTECCCGTSEGNCCGMACCGVEAPQPEKNSGAPSPSVKNLESDLVGASGAAAIGAKECVFFNRVHASVPASGAPSLCTLKVRLQI